MVPLLGPERSPADEPLTYHGDVWEVDAFGRVTKGQSACTLAVMSITPRQLLGPPVLLAALAAWWGTESSQDWVAKGCERVVQV
jgi:hypothetical protein